MLPTQSEDLCTSVSKSEKPWPLQLRLLINCPVTKMLFELIIVVLNKQ
jgi:hypothetical protein